MGIPTIHRDLSIYLTQYLVNHYNPFVPIQFNTLTMDQIKNALSSNSSSSHNNAPTNTNNQNEDYLDKGLDAAEKKFGGAWGQDTQKNRAMNEKITDGARDMFEKATGKNVPDKFSN